MRKFKPKRRMVVFLQSMQNEVLHRIPTFQEIVKYYGPFLGLVIFFVISFMVMQYVWYNKLLSAKQKEIDRIVIREDELNKRLMILHDKQIGYTKAKKQA